MSILSASQIRNLSGNPILNSTGNVINVYHAYDTTQSVYTQTADINLTALSITLTPVSTNSRFILSSVISLTTNYVIGFGFKRNGNRIGKATTNINSGLGTNLANIWFIAHANNTYIFQQPIIDIDSPATTSSITYYPFITNNWSGGGYGFYYNSRSTADMGSTSTFTIYEIAG